MNTEPRESFRLSAFMDDELIESALPPATELLTMLENGRIWGEACIYSETDQFPRANVSFHPGDGFVVQCYEDETSWSDFLISAPVISAPRIQIELGGLATERWPPELFVPEIVAREALEFFFESGKQKPSLHWVRIDRFPREVLRESRADRDSRGRL